jgi:hypothetical protein
MDNDDFEKAHFVYQMIDAMIVGAGREMLEDLTAAEQEYVITKLHDEFRFWRLET